MLIHQTFSLFSNLSKHPSSHTGPSLFIRSMSILNIHLNQSERSSKDLKLKYSKNFKSEFVLHTRKSEGYCIKEKKFTRLPIRFFLYLLSLGIQCVFIIISMFIEMFMLYLLSYIERLQNSSSFYECSWPGENLIQLQESFQRIGLLHCTIINYTRRACRI